jgi:hypothetical protein
MWRGGGASTLYRGFTAPFLAQGLYKSVIFTTNTIVNKHVFDDGKKKMNPQLKIFLSGCIAGTASSVFVSPIEQIRTQQITMTTDSRVKDARLGLGAWDRVRSITNDGKNVARLWRSLIPTVLRDAPGVGLYLLTFASTKDAIISSRRSRRGHQHPLSFYDRMMAGSLSGVAFWLWAFPLDTVKTRIENSPASSNVASPSHTRLGSGSTHLSQLISPCRQIYSEGGGISGFYRGMPVALLRGVPAAAVTLACYDKVLELLAA